MLEIGPFSTQNDFLTIESKTTLGELPGITTFAIGILLAVDERLLLLNYGERQTCEGVAFSFFSKTGDVLLSHEDPRSITVFP